MLSDFLSSLQWNKAPSGSKMEFEERRWDFMKDIFCVGSSVETRRQFIERNGLLIVAALMHPPSSLVRVPTRSDPRKNCQQKDATKISPVEDLMREHGVLARILLVYDEILVRLNKGTNFPPEVLAKSAGLIRRFVEDYHEKLEEKHVFPQFEKEGRLANLVRVLLEQHQAGRLLTDRIKSLANLQTLKRPTEKNQLCRYLQLFSRMYRPHKAREDTILFPAFHAAVPPEEFDAMGEAFEDQEEDLFGKGGFEKVVAEVEDLEKAIGIHELAQFTPEG
jgi:hemerythrin-like domain-containing protein